MTQPARFCTSCGTSLEGGPNFCTSCGTPVAMVAPPESVPAVAEAVLAVIPNTMFKTGFMGVGSKAGVLVLTERRVIFAHTTSEMMKQSVAEARDGAKEQGKGFFGQWGAQLSAHSASAERYLTMHPEHTLAQTPVNFAIENSTIQKARIKAGYTDENGQTGSDRLIIKTTGGSYTFTLGSGGSRAKQALVAAHLI